MDYQSLLNEANDKQKHKFNIIGHTSRCVKGILRQADPYCEVYPSIMKPTKPSLGTFIQDSAALGKITKNRKPFLHS